MPTDTYDHLENRWGPMLIGASPAAPQGRVHCRVVWQQRGDQIHAWAKFRAMGKVIMVHASTDVAAIMREIKDEWVRRQMSDLQQRGARHPAGAVSGGWFKKAWRKAKRAIKKVAKKTGVVKVLKAVHGAVEKALDNKWVKMALASNPYGAAFLAAHKATQVAFKAIKGSKIAKAAIRKLKGESDRGSKRAKNVLHLMAKGVKANPGLFNKNSKLHKLFAAAAGADPTVEEIAALVQGCTESSPVSAGEYHAVMGADGEPGVGEEVDFLETFASSGAFDGARWFARRMGLHSMNAHPDELTARGALLWGRTAQGQRFQLAPHNA